jgi:hypothetical protein
MFYFQLLTLSCPVVANLAKMDSWLTGQPTNYPTFLKMAKPYIFYG